MPGEGRPLERVLFVMRPLVRFLVRHGIGYGALSIALKRIFLDEARRELQRGDMAMTGSALSLLAGLHRHNVRSLAREQKSADAPAAAQSPGVAVQAAAVTNMLGDARFVELAVYVDEISPASAAALQEACKTALNQALHKVHAAAQAHHQSDLKRPAPERTQRARCGVHFCAEPMQ